MRTLTCRTCIIAGSNGVMCSEFIMLSREVARSFCAMLRYWDTPRSKMRPGKAFVWPFGFLRWPLSWYTYLGLEFRPERACSTLMGGPRGSLIFPTRIDVRPLSDRCQSLRRRKRRLRRQLRLDALAYCQHTEMQDERAQGCKSKQTGLGQKRGRARRSLTVTIH